MEFEITVMFSCVKCGIHRRLCKVPARGNEGVKDWMDSVSIRLKAEHSLVSPNCDTEVLSEVMIPISGSEKIGGPTVN